MALDGVDPNIALQAGRNLPQPGPNWDQVQAMQRTAISLQQAQQVQDAHNALKTLYTNPKNFDPKTFQPTQEAWGQLFRVSPAAGMDLRNNLATLQQKQAVIANQQQEANSGWVKRGLDEVGKPALDEYNSAISENVPPQVAIQRAQKVYTDNMKTLQDSGMPDVLKSQMSPTFDPIRIGKNLQTIQQQQAAENLKKEGYQPVVQASPTGQPQQVWAAPGKPTLDMAGNQITPTGMPEVKKGDEPDLYTVKDKDGNQVTARRAVSGGFVNDETSKPIPGATEPRKIGTAISPGSSQLSPEAIKQIADQYLAGDKSALQGLGWGAVGSVNRAAIRDELAKRGASGTDIAAAIAEFGGIQAGERALGTRSASLGMALSEARIFAPMALESSNKIDRTQYPTLNSVILAAEKGTGGEEVARFNVANRSLIGVYSQVLRRGGAPSDQADREATSLLEQAYSKGQYAAAVDQIMKEATGAQAAPATVREELRGAITGKPSSFGVPTPEPQNQAGREVPITPTAKAPAGTGSVPEITEQQYNALPPGSPYRMPGNPTVMYK
jgi:hypothetical protein